jgi:hypothetical protein
VLRAAPEALPPPPLRSPFHCRCMCLCALRITPKGCAICPTGIPSNGHPPPPLRPSGSQGRVPAGCCGPALSLTGTPPPQGLRAPPPFLHSPSALYTELTLAPASVPDWLYPWHPPREGGGWVPCPPPRTAIPEPRGLFAPNPFFPGLPSGLTRKWPTRSCDHRSNPPHHRTPSPPHSRLPASLPPSPSPHLPPVSASLPTIQMGERPGAVATF